ncbi:MAG: LacI family DNA-binding transcriptional regulator [Pseudomonadota bacterium]
MVVTLKEVAARAGVSRSAVSRTFTDGASVSNKMRRKVETAANELGYSPNALASSLTTGRTKLIGLVASNFHNPFFLEVFDLFTQSLQNLGLRPLLVNLSGETTPENSIRMLRQYSVDGVVVASSTLPPSFAQAFRDAGVPVVHSFGRATEHPQTHVVGIDNFACGRMAAETLIARGYRRVGFMGGPATATSTQDRHRGFMTHVVTRPDMKATISFADAYTFDAGRAEMARLLADEPMDAYFCGDDVLSIGALSAIADSGRKCPEDVGVIGLNDMEMARWGNIDLTTIRQPIDEIVAASIAVMTGLLEDPEKDPDVRLFPCAIIERGTLRPLLEKKFRSD